MHTRTKMLIGDIALKKLTDSRVAVFGIGGVGGYIAEALVRSGIGHIDILDKDIIDITNINRQIVADYTTIGKDKVEVMLQRLQRINPQVSIGTYKCFYMPDNASDYPLEGYDYIADAIDVVTAKLELIVRAKAAGTRIISAMGTGNKLDPAKLEISDIYDTSICPLARVMRRELRVRGIEELQVVYSKEEPKRSKDIGSTPSSMTFVPASAGILMASKIIRDIIDIK